MHVSLSPSMEEVHAHTHTRARTQAGGFSARVPDDGLTSRRARRGRRSTADVAFNSDARGRAERAKNPHGAISRQSPAVRRAPAAPRAVPLATEEELQTAVIANRQSYVWQSNCGFGRRPATTTTAPLPRLCSSFRRPTVKQSQRQSHRSTSSSSVGGGCRLTSLRVVGPSANSPMSVTPPPRPTMYDRHTSRGRGHPGRGWQRLYG